MGMRRKELPEPLPGKLRMLGEVGQRWLDDLDSLIAELEHEWWIRVGEALTGGSEAFVAAATDNQGQAVVLKVAMPPLPGNTWFVNEVRALRLADGNGYARLLKYDLKRRAMLLERLGTPLSQAGLPAAEQIRIICRVLRRAWIPQPETAAPGDVCRGFVQLLDELAAGTEFAAPLVSGARQLCMVRLREWQPAGTVLVHGDAHSSNLLEAGEGSEYKLIDPDGLIAEPAYDLGVLMREWVEELKDSPIQAGRERAAYISQLTGVDSGPIWQWGAVQCVATGLLLWKSGLSQVGRDLLQVAEDWLGYLLRGCQS